MDAQGKTTIVWVLYALGIVTTGTPFIGFILALFFKNTNAVPGVAGHNAAQRRAFWWGLLGWIACIVILVVGALRAESATDADAVIGGLLIVMAIIVLVVIQLAFTVYAIIGTVRASKGRDWPGAKPYRSEEVFG